MVVIHRSRLGRKISGGRYIPARGKRKFEIGHSPTLTTIQKQKLKKVRTKGGGEKTRVLTAEVANVFDPKTKTFSKAKIKTVKECPADEHYVRPNIIVKGSIIETEKGLARVTSRPGQDGTINAILI
ncbi:MAG: 30S ribosomal protein S8e [Candidatus Woesearchaeota archaeon]